MAQDQQDQINEWRGDVCVRLRDKGYGELADDFAGYSDEEAETWRVAHPDPDDAALAFAMEAY